MANVFVEPTPDGTAYSLKYEGGESVSGVRHRTQATAVNAAYKAGHHPLVAWVAHSNTRNPDHWRKI